MRHFKTELPTLAKQKNRDDISLRWELKAAEKCKISL